MSIFDGSANMLDRMFALGGQAVEAALGFLNPSGRNPNLTYGEYVVNNATVNALDYYQGVDGADWSAALSRGNVDAVAAGRALELLPGTYRISNVISLAKVKVHKGAKFVFDNGRTVTFTEVPELPDFEQVFDVSGAGFGGPIFAKQLPKFHFEWFGVKGDGTTDDTALLIRAGQFFQTMLGTKGELRPGATYRCFPAGTTAGYGSQILVNMTSAMGKVIEGNGATISLGDLLANGAQAHAFYMFDSKNIVIRNVNIIQDNPSLVNASTAGVSGFTVSGNSERIHIENVSQTGGGWGLQCRGEWPAQQYRAKNITLLNAKFHTVYYAQSFQGSGDNYFARGIETINCGRGYFPWNVRNHDVRMYSEHGGPFDDVLLKAYGYVGRYSRLDNIKLSYHTGGRYAAGTAQGNDSALIAVACGMHADVSGVPVEGPVTLANLDIHVVCEDSTFVPVTQRILTFRKTQKDDSSADTTGRGHNIVNFRLSGMLNVGTAMAGGNAIDIFADPTYAWAGDFAQNVALEDLQIKSDPAEIAVSIDGVPFINGFGGYSERNVSTDGQIVRTNFTFNRNKELVNTASEGFLVQDTPQVFTPTWSGSGADPDLGDGTLTGKFFRRGQHCRAVIDLVIGSTTTLGTGDWRFALPAGVSVHTADTPLPSAGVATDVSAPLAYPLAVDVTVASPARAEAYAVTGTVGDAIPFAWAAGDKLRLTLEWMTNS